MVAIAKKKERVIRTWRKVDLLRKLKLESLSLGELSNRDGGTSKIPVEPYCGGKEIERSLSLAGRQGKL